MHVGVACSIAYGRVICCLQVLVVNVVVSRAVVSHVVVAQYAASAVHVACNGITFAVHACTVHHHAAPDDVVGAGKTNMENSVSIWKPR